MSKIKKNNPVKTTEKVVTAESIHPVEEKTWLEKLTSGYLPYLIIALLSIVLYANTFKHQFALDDDIVICKNEFVLRGIQGLPDLFKKDLFDSFYKQMNTTAQLSGGRYRPLSVASFALEQEWIGTREDAKFEPNCWDVNKNGKQDIEEDVNGDGQYNDKDYRSQGFTLRHIDNVLFYALACCMLFLFLSTVVFKEKPILALLITLLFLAHPIHTEVVANVKSRDEIFSFLFMIASLFFAHQYDSKGKIKFVLLSCLAFFCALLSKEYGATLLVLIPLSLYLFGQNGLKLSKHVMLFVGMLVLFGFYYKIRIDAIGNMDTASNLQLGELMNNPYLLATHTQEIATKIFMFLNYLWKLIFPMTLCSDYGYNSIPYKNLSDLSVWMSVIAIFGMVIGGIVGLVKKNWVAFALAFYLLNILLVTNLIFNVGATMGERLAFHSSLGFCMLLGYALYWIGQKVNVTAASKIALFITVPILFLYSVKTIARNNAWKNDISLALTDVEINPESISLNGNACSRYIDLSEWPINKPKEKEYFLKAVEYGKKSIALHPSFVNGYLNLGIAYAKLEQYDSAKKCCDIAFKIYPHHPSKTTYYNMLAEVYYQKGFKLGGEKKWAEGLVFLQTAIDINPTNARYWYDLGGFAYNAQNFAKAKEAWTKAYELNPKDTNIIKVQHVFP